MKQPFLKQPTSITQVCTNSSDSTPSQLHEERSSLFFTRLPTAHLNSMVFDFYSLFFSLTDLAVLEWEPVFHATKRHVLYHWLDTQLSYLLLHWRACVQTAWSGAFILLMYLCMWAYAALVYMGQSEDNLRSLVLLLVSQSWQQGFVPR